MSNPPPRCGDTGGVPAERRTVQFRHILRVREPRWLWLADIDVNGYRSEDSWFHLAAGTECLLALYPNSAAARARLVQLA